MGRLFWKDHGLILEGLQVSLAGHLGQHVKQRVLQEPGPAEKPLRWCVIARPYQVIETPKPSPNHLKNDIKQDFDVIYLVFSYVVH